jgi:hypothetical protein
VLHVPRRLARSDRSSSTLNSAGATMFTACGPIDPIEKSPSSAKHATGGGDCAFPSSRSSRRNSSPINGPHGGRCLTKSSLK